MKRKLQLFFVFLVTIILLNAPAVYGVDINFDSSGVIESGQSYDTVWIYDTPPETTTVDVYGAIYEHLLTSDSSTVNLFGDEYYNGAWVLGAMSIYNSSTLNFRGGFWTAETGRYLQAYNSSTVNVYDGIVGLASMANFSLRDTSTGNIYGGSGAAPYVTEEFSTINIYDGVVNTLAVYDSSTANIYGGEIGGRYGFKIHPSAIANIYGYGFEYNPQAWWNEGFGWHSEFTGYGPDGTPIRIIDMPDPYTTPNINLIPEPATFLLMGMGSLALLRKRQKS